MLADKVRERDEIISRDLFPLMDDRQRDRHLDALEPAIAAGQRAVDELAALVGDPETVCDERGCPRSAGRSTPPTRRTT